MLLLNRKLLNVQNKKYSIIHYKCFLVSIYLPNLAVFCASHISQLFMIFCHRM